MFSVQFIDLGMPMTYDTFEDFDAVVKFIKESSYYIAIVCKDDEVIWICKKF